PLIGISFGNAWASNWTPIRDLDAVEVSVFWPALVSALLFLTSVVLYLLMLYAYDRLLMPSRYWSERIGALDESWPVKRPPSSENRLLYQNMTNIWRWMFLPGISRRSYA